MTRLNVGNIRHPDGTDDNITLDSSGRVGIGTPSPSTGLEVATGSIFCSSGGLYLNELGGTSSVYLSYGGGNPILMNGANGALRFGTNNGEKARIDSSGNFKFDSGYGSVATAYGCRAWVNFDGTGTVAIRGSGNVSSITDNAEGDYTVNFTTSMPDANYAVAHTGGIQGAEWGIHLGSLGSPPSTASYRFSNVTPADAKRDSARIYLTFFR